MRDSLTLPRAAIPYLYRKHLTWDVQTIIIQPQNYRKWADFICNKLNRTKLFNDESRPPPQNRCMLTDYLIRKPIVFSVRVVVGQSTARGHDDDMMITLEGIAES